MWLVFLQVWLFTYWTRTSEWTRPGNRHFIRPHSNSKPGKLQGHCSPKPRTARSVSLFCPLDAWPAPRTKCLHDHRCCGSKRGTNLPKANSQSGPRSGPEFGSFDGSSLQRLAHFQSSWGRRQDKWRREITSQGSKRNVPWAKAQVPIHISYSKENDK